MNETYTTTIDFTDGSSAVFTYPSREAYDNDTAVRAYAEAKGEHGHVKTKRRVHGTKD